MISETIETKATNWRESSKVQIKLKNLKEVEKHSAAKTTKPVKGGSCNSGKRDRKDGKIKI